MKRVFGILMAVILSDLLLTVAFNVRQTWQSLKAGARHTEE